MEDIYNNSTNNVLNQESNLGFLARWRRRQETGDSDAFRNRSRLRLGWLLRRKSSETQTTSEIELNNMIDVTKKLGKRVLRLVDAVRTKIIDETLPPVRRQQENILDDARSDMQGAMDGLYATSKGVKEPTMAYSPEYQPRPAAAGLAEFTLALMGGGLLLSAMGSRGYSREHLKVGSERHGYEAKQQRQQEQLDGLKRELSEHTKPDYAQRVSEFTHHQAEVTREVAREAREYQSRVPAESELFKVPVVQKPALERNDLRKPYHEILHQSLQFGSEPIGPVPRDSTHLSYKNATTLQSAKNFVKKHKQVFKKRKIKNHDSTYAVVFITIVIILVILLLTIK